MKVIPFNRLNLIFIKNINNAICFKHHSNYLSFYYVKNGNVHNEKFHAAYHVYPKLIIRAYSLYGIHYIVPNKCWKKKVKELKRKEKLNIFI